MNLKEEIIKLSGQGNFINCIDVDDAERIAIEYAKSLTPNPATREELLEKAKSFLDKSIECAADDDPELYEMIAKTMVDFTLSALPQMSVDDLINRLDEILQPAYGNSVYKWHTIEKAVRYLFAAVTKPETK